MMLSVIYPESLETFLSNFKGMDSDIAQEYIKKSADAPKGVYKLAVLLNEKNDVLGLTIFKDLKDSNLAFVFEEIEKPNNYSKYCKHVKTHMKDHVYIDWFCICDEYQECGYGEFLFKEVYGGKDALLYSLAESTGFWERMGFRYFFHEEYHMEKTLAPITGKIKKAFEALNGKGYKATFQNDGSLYFSGENYAFVMDPIEHSYGETCHDGLFISWSGEGDEIKAAFEDAGLTTVWDGKPYSTMMVKV